MSLFTHQSDGPPRSTQATAKSAVLQSEFGSLDQYYKQASVDCMTQLEKTVYITARGEIFPCCFLAGQVRYANPGDDGEMLKQIMIKTRGGESGISALESSIQDVTDTGWFNAIAENWKHPGDAPETVKTCRRMCGSHLKLVSAEYK